MGDFRLLARSGAVVILDSGLGSELERLGVDVSPPLWSARALLAEPGAIEAIHGENVRAGARIVTAATFRTAAHTLRKAGRESEAGRMTASAVELARSAAADSSSPVLVAGSIAPLEDCYRPDLVPETDVLEREHRAHAENLARAGVDLILVETMSSIRELLAASAAAAATGVPFVASIVTDGRGRLLSGEPIEAAIRAVQVLRPDGVGVNCVASDRIGEEVERISALESGVAIAAYGNTLSTGDDPETYAGRARRWRDSGARIIGGCCGTTAAHVTALSLVFAES